MYTLTQKEKVSGVQALMVHCGMRLSVSKARLSRRLFSERNTKNVEWPPKINDAKTNATQIN